MGMVLALVQMGNRALSLIPYFLRTAVQGVDEKNVRQSKKHCAKMKIAYGNNFNDNKTCIIRL